MTTPIDPDRLASLEEQERFLLRSLDDLEREFLAGDVDETDYRELRDGYTVRAAATMRAIDEGRSSLPPRPPADWARRAVGSIVVVALIGVVWWALSASSAQRLPGQQISGLDPRDQRQVLMSQASAIQSTDPASAADLYALVLEDTPDDVEALTYRGWTLAISSVGLADSELVVTNLQESVELLTTAIDVDPTYPDPYCFLGIIQANFLQQPDAAAPYLQTCLANDPPADVRGLVQGLLDRVTVGTEPTQ